MQNISPLHLVQGHRYMPIHTYRPQAYISSYCYTIYMHAYHQPNAPRAGASIHIYTYVQATGLHQLLLPHYTPTCISSAHCTSCRGIDTYRYIYTGHRPTSAPAAIPYTYMQNISPLHLVQGIDTYRYIHTGHRPTSAPAATLYTYMQITSPLHLMQGIHTYRYIHTGHRPTSAPAAILYTYMQIIRPLHLVQGIDTYRYTHTGHRPTAAPAAILYTYVQSMRPLHLVQGIDTRLYIYIGHRPTAAPAAILYTYVQSMRPLHLVQGHRYMAIHIYRPQAYSSTCCSTIYTHACRLKTHCTSCRASAHTYSRRYAPIHICALQTGTLPSFSPNSNHQPASPPTHRASTSPLFISLPPSHHTHLHP